MKYSHLLLIILFFASVFFQNAHAQCVDDADIYRFSTPEKSYAIIKQEKSWADAAACAVALGGTLTEINSQEEQDLIYNAIINDAGVSDSYTRVNDGGGIAYVWIGASDQTEEGTWIWDGNGDGNGDPFWTGQGTAGDGGGSPVDDLYSFWGGTSAGEAREPDDFQSAQDAAAIALGGWPSFSPGSLGEAGEWNDISAANELYYVVEFNCSHTEATVETTACGSYTSPSGQIWTESGTYQDIIPNSLGCDSVITFILEFEEVNTEVSVSSNSLTAVADGVTYQWVDCDNDFAPISGANAKTFTPGVAGNYAVIITTNSGCSATSNCFSVVTSLEDESEFNSVIQYGPNPSEDGKVKIFVPKKYADAFTVSVYDLSGKETLYTNQFHNTQTVELELGNTAGIYLIKVEYKGRVLDSFKVLRK